MAAEGLREKKEKKKVRVATLFVAAERWISADERWLTGSLLGCQRATPAPFSPRLSIVVVVVGGGLEDLFSVEGRCRTAAGRLLPHTHTHLLDPTKTCPHELRPSFILVQRDQH